MAEAGICRWGILSTAEIGRKNWKAIRLAGNATVTAVASRQLDAAQRFIDQCQAEGRIDPPPRALDNYQALVEASDVDAVYVPLPTALRREWVIRLAEAGKHVLVEKPGGVSTADVEQMVEACRKNKVQFMDGVMFMHSSRLPLIRQILEQGELGTVSRITTQFTFFGDETFERTNIRTHSDLEPDGCLGDLGWYCIRIILWLLQGRLPQRVSARLWSTMKRPDSPRPVPGSLSAELFYEDGLSAGFFCSFRADNQQWVHISGTHGCLRIPDFVLPRYGGEVEFFVDHDQYEIDGCSFRMVKREQRYAAKEYDSGTRESQETAMVRTFSEYVLSRHIDETWPRWTLSTQKVLDACRQSAYQDGKLIELA
ncbi:MAG: oxidoreductase [Pirellulaceae bacterium]|nr:MAG: oxidoreductase [Pirellulaceae bacterium]